VDATDPIRAAGKMNKLERLKKIIAQRNAAMDGFCTGGRCSPVSKYALDTVRGVE